MAVVAGGRLCCCGSPLFLRRHLGSGYYLTLAKRPPSLSTPKKVSVISQSSPGPQGSAQPGGRDSEGPSVHRVMLRCQTGPM